MSDQAAPQTTEKKYDGGTIRVLKGLEAVKLRPGMYIGDVDDGSGLHHMLWEILDNSVDEGQDGHANKISVVVHEDNSITVTDNGRGIPTDYNSEEKTSAAVLALTRLHAGGKFDQNSYKTSGGLHGVGAAVVNALSDWMTARIWREGKEHLIRFHNGGDIEQDLMVVGDSDRRGTEITFLPSLSTFAFIHMDGATIRSRIRNLACLNPGIEFSYKDERTSDPVVVYRFDRGIYDMVKILDKNKTSIIGGEPISIDSPSIIKVPAKDDQPESEIEARVAVAFEWCDDYSSSVACYTNNIPQSDGGTHLVGAKSALLNAIRAYAENMPGASKGKGKSNAKKKNMEITGDDIFEGMTFILNLKLPNPKFSSQTKSKLVSQEAHKAVYPIVQECITRWLEENPAYAKIVIEKIMSASEARVSAREAVKNKRETARKSVLDIACMPGKLTDCRSRDSSRTELFLVEGDSAGGTAKQARDNEFQAILPLKGKILNTERASVKRILTSAEVGTLINALGVMGIGQNCDLSSLRYNKIIIMTDADVDGGHIRSLLLTFFYRHMPALVKAGHIYVAKPPLYGLVRKGRSDEIEFILDSAEMARKTDEIIAEKAHIEYKTINDDGEEQIVKLEGDDLIAFMSNIRVIAGQIDKINHSMGNRDLNEAGIMSGIMDFSILKEQGEDAVSHIVSFMEKRMPKSRWSGEIKDTGVEFCWRVRGVDKKAFLDYSYLSDIAVRILSQKSYQHIMPMYFGIPDAVFVTEAGERIPFMLPSDAIQIADSMLDTVVKEVKRFKGLGEMNDSQLKLTAMDPETRSVFQVFVPEDIEAVENVFTGFMGGETEYRKERIEEAMSTIVASDDAGGDE